MLNTKGACQNGGSFRCLVRCLVVEHQLVSLVSKVAREQRKALTVGREVGIDLLLAPERGPDRKREKQKGGFQCIECTDQWRFLR